MLKNVHCYYIENQCQIYIFFIKIQHFLVMLQTLFGFSLRGRWETAQKNTDLAEGGAENLFKGDRS